MDDDRAGAVGATAERRLQGLLGALLELQTGVDLDDTLRRIVRVTADLVDARHGALEVLDAGGASSSQVVHVGAHEETADRTGAVPGGPGVLALPITVRGEVYGNLRLSGRRGGPFTPEDERVAGALVAAAGIAVDNARRLADERERRRWAGAVDAVREQLLGDAAPDHVLQMITDAVRQLTGSDAAHLMAQVDVPGTWTSRAQSGADLADVTGVPLTSAYSAVVEVLGRAEAGRGLELDLAGRPWSEQGEGRGWGPLLGATLHTADGDEAVLVVARHAGARAYDHRLVALLEAFADQAALALDTAARQRLARSLDVYADRDRIARDLHDQVIQQLFAAGLTLQAVLPTLPAGVPRERVLDVVGLLDTVVRDIRSTVFDLHTVAGDARDTSLRRRVLDALAESSGSLRTSLRTQGPVDSLVTGTLAADVEAVVREAVTNVTRHAGASSVTVAVEVADAVVVEVVDDGVGADPAAARSGLANLAARARARGGELSVTRPATGGTRLRWRSPLG